MPVGFLLFGSFVVALFSDFPTRQTYLWNKTAPTRTTHDADSAVHRYHRREMVTLW